jgi:hypothetical protein
VLKACFDALPQAQTPDRKAAIEQLLTHAPEPHRVALAGQM